MKLLKKYEKLILSIIVIIVFLISTQSHSQIPEDKKKHFIGGAIVGGLTNLAVYGFTENTKAAFWSGIGMAVVAGVVKESMDTKEGRSGWDSKDLLATGLGGVAVTLPLNFWERRDKKKKLRKEAFNIK